MPDTQVGNKCLIMEKTAQLDFPFGFETRQLCAAKNSKQPSRNLDICMEFWFSKNFIQFSFPIVEQASHSSMGNENL